MLVLSPIHRCSASDHSSSPPQPPSCSSCFPPLAGLLHLLPNYFPTSTQNEQVDQIVSILYSKPSTASPQIKVLIALCDSDPTPPATPPQAQSIQRAGPFLPGQCEAHSCSMSSVGLHFACRLLSHVAPRPTPSSPSRLANCHHLLVFSSILFYFILFCGCLGQRCCNGCEICQIHKKLSSSFPFLVRIQNDWVPTLCTSGIFFSANL